MYRLVDEFSDQKWHNIEYGICGEYCIGVCNIFARLGFICVWDIVWYLWEILPDIYMVVSLVGGMVGFNGSSK